MDVQLEEQQLAKAERGLQATREVIAEQRLLIEELRYLTAELLCQLSGV